MWDHNTNNNIGLFPPFPLRELSAFIHGFAANSPCTWIPKMQEELAEREGVSLSFWEASLS